LTAVRPVTRPKLGVAGVPDIGVVKELLLLILAKRTPVPYSGFVLCAVTEDISEDGREPFGIRQKARENESSVESGNAKSGRSVRLRI
jgi:hypothetical protein